MELLDLAADRWLQRSAANHHELGMVVLPRQPRQCLDQQLRALLRDETSDKADDKIVRR